MTISSIIRSRFFIVGCLFLTAAALSYVWATKLMQSIYDYRSPLHYIPPEYQEPLGHAISQRLVIVLVDGLREDTSQDTELMPYLDTLRDEGAWGVMHSRPLSYSQPGYSTLFIGAWPDINDGPAINLDPEDIRVWTQDNLFSAVHRVGGRTAVAASATFEKLIPRTDVDASFFTEETNQAGDELIFDQALQWLDAGGQSLMLVHFSQVDDAGDHLGGPRGQAWAEAATRVDAMIQTIGEHMDFTKDTLMIVSDHGQIDAGGHGGPEPDNLLEPFIMVGSGVWPGYYNKVQMVDVAPTAAALLGAAIPASTQGHILTWMLYLNEEVDKALPSLVEKQQSGLYRDYTDAIGVDSTLKDNPDPVQKYQAGIDRARENRLRGGVTGRIFFMLAVVGVLAYFAWKFRGRALLERMLWFLVYALVFAALYVLVFRQTFSLSRVETETGLILMVVVSSVAGFLAAWLASALLRRVFTEKPERIADHTLALAGVFMILLAVPVAVHFVINGTIAIWTLPEMTTGFFGLLSMMQILSLSVLGGLLAAGAALVKQQLLRREGPGRARMNFVPAPDRLASGRHPGKAKRRTGRGGRKR
jgi:hypothetical protein